MTDTTRSPAQAAADLFKQWIILSSHVSAKSPVLPKSSFGGPASRNFQLKNGRVRKFLHWEDQIGFNVGWTNNAEPETALKAERWFFLREDGADRPMRYGESVAIGNGNDPSFMCYEERTVGVNLQWHTKPSFEWLLLGGPQGQDVRTNEWLAIYNEKDKECLIYCDRTLGGDLGWPSSKTWWDQGKDILEKLAKEEAKKAAEQAVTYLMAA